MPEKKERDGGKWQIKFKAANQRAEDAGYATGYETDGDQSVSGTRRKLRKKKQKSQGTADAGYETDDGYVSSSSMKKVKSKSSFFKLGNRSKTAVVDPPAEATPPVPPLAPPVFRLPIAEKFATTLKDINVSATVDPPSPSQPSESKLDLAISDPGLSLTSSPPSSASTNILTPKDGDQPQIFNFDGIQSNSVLQVVSSDSDFHGYSPGKSLFTKWTPAPTTKFPPISLPLTRSPSPPPSPLQPQQSSPVKAGAKRPEHLTLHSDDNSRKEGSTPLLTPESSPFVVLTPIDTSAPPPSEPPPPTTTGKSRFFSRSNNENPNNTSPSKTGGIHFPNFFSRSAASTPPPNPQPPTAELPLVNPPVEKHNVRPPVIIPPSPVQEGSILPSPVKILASHDLLPPPSSSPTIPLPDIPSDFDADGNVHEQRSRSPLRPISPLHRHASTRGRESPFPSKPVLPRNGSTIPGGTSRVMFETKLNVPRYRELYALPLSQPNSQSNSPNPSRPVTPEILYQTGGGGGEGFGSTASLASSSYHSNKRVRFRSSVKTGIDIQAPSDEENEGEEDYDGASDEELRRVVDRFGPSTSDLGHGSSEMDEPALSRNRSVEAANRTQYEARRRRRRAAQRLEDAFAYAGRSGVGEGNLLAPSEYDTESDLSHAGHGFGLYADPDRAYSATSLPSEVGSRASFMDAEKSELARKRFLKRVEEMYGDNGREKLVGFKFGIGMDEEIPPVPKIPSGLTTAASSNWF